ncbi:hypothetical protein [Listeria booriae]|uniref:Uncharacterized protein n=1 Tax=Listeria booriae TaxID=1552123 RepID=A0A7X0XC19_9LIST|nr:hypothetical protein [Listeria booriae]MBC1491440.1 hypothetical protein [Listeria booriae]MBC1525467.1 hypothetical protein [Listeria booriae]MBC1983450.1 hypothetical protein [Listeria booriae]MBC6150076.1 hypothetical protein [Listeria booriae]
MTHGIQESVYAPSALAVLTKNHQQKELAIDNHVTQSLVSQQAAGKRKVSKQIAQSYIDNYNEPFSAMIFASKFTNGIIPPLFDGLDQHQMSLSYRFEKESSEAMNEIQNQLEVFSEAIKESSQKQNVAAKHVIAELLDVVATTNTFIANIACKYKIDLVQEAEEREKIWKEQGLIKAR